MADRENPFQRIMNRAANVGQVQVQDQDQESGAPIVTGYNQQLVQQALGFANRGIGDQREAMQESLGGIESSLFDQMGRMQLQTERDIGQRRMQALRSGMPSSQLAAMELQNVQTAQLGAQQMAREYDQLRMEMDTQLAGAEDMAAYDMFQTLAQGRTDQSAIEAQRFASDLGAQMESLLGAEEWASFDTDQRVMLAQALNGVPPEKLSEHFDKNPGAMRRLANTLGNKEDGLTEDDTDFIKTLGPIAGGVVIGALLGGPKGAVAGGAAGIIASIVGAFRKSEQETSD